MGVGERELCSTPPPTGVRENARFELFLICEVCPKLFLLFLSSWGILLFLASSEIETSSTTSLVDLWETLARFAGGSEDVLLLLLMALEVERERGKNSGLCLCSLCLIDPPLLLFNFFGFRHFSGFGSPGCFPWIEDDEKMVEENGGEWAIISVEDLRTFLLVPLFQHTPLAI